jgi:hypothetical protein
MKFLRLLLVTGTLLLIPIIASRFVEGWNWAFSDYVFAGVMFFGTGALFEIGRMMSSNISYRVGFGLALLTGFMIIWGNLAVGFIGSEDNPANLMYFGVLALSFLSAIAARFDAPGMARVMFGTAFGIALVPVIALVMKSTFAEIPEAAGVTTIFALNFFFVILFIGSGLLFKQSSEPTHKQVQ